jgi:hypothetical protein
MFTASEVISSFQLRGDDNFISFDRLISLYHNVVVFSYLGNYGFGFCKEIFLNDDPELTIYSVEHEKKFRHLKLDNFDYIEVRKL